MQKRLSHRLLGRELQKRATVQPFGDRELDVTQERDTLDARRIEFAARGKADIQALELYLAGGSEINLGIERFVQGRVDLEST